MPLSLEVAARDSNLSKAQVQEILELFKGTVIFNTHYVQTRGDKDKLTSLRTLPRDDFFTREIDEMLQRGQCRIAIHSAKDLPDPLPDGLALIALTAPLDSSDSLVLRTPLRPHMTIATSSLRREKSVRMLCNRINFVDIRGTIEERLDKLHRGEVDGVVIAEAALIRLHLTHLLRLRLPGPTAPLQGSLAIIARADDEKMKTLFAPYYC